MTAAAEPAESGRDGFRVRLANFEGPFDLLLSLINQHRLDVTEVALHQVTDEFIAYTKSLGADVDLDSTTQFLLVAATLLDLKAARLLPSGEVENQEDLEVLHARDLLFARLLQYRAFRQIAVLFAELEAAAMLRYPRAIGLEERYAGLLPEIVLGVDPAGFAEVAALAFRPRAVPQVGLGHLHAPKVSVQEQAAHVYAALVARGQGEWLSFGELVADRPETVVVVARFLALLELFREKTVEFAQDDPLGQLSVAWTGVARAGARSTDEEYG